MVFLRKKTIKKIERVEADYGVFYSGRNRNGPSGNFFVCIVRSLFSVKL